MEDFAEHERRVARNETMFREANEELGDEAEVVLRARGGLTSYMCECGDPSCARNLSMTKAQYEAVRADPRRFMVVPGHEMPDVEQVVERHERFWVVEKPGDGPAGEIVRATDERRRG